VFPFSGSGVRLAYSSPSCPMDGRETEGGRGGRSLEVLLARLLEPWSLELWWIDGSFNGERAKVSRPGETDRSTLRFGRAGILGMSMFAELGAVACWVRAGRGGIDGAAMIANDGLVEAEYEYLCFME
jgi:hypothetical protein